jgi:hypothetical protein
MQFVETGLAALPRGPSFSIHFAAALRRRAFWRAAFPCPGGEGLRFDPSGCGTAAS